MNWKVHYILSLKKKVHILQKRNWIYRVFGLWNDYNIIYSRALPKESVILTRVRITPP